MVVRHGVAFAKIKAMDEEELDRRLSEAELSTDGTVEERQVRLWEGLLPVYSMPANLPAVSQIVFAAVLDEDNEPRPEGADRNAVISELIEFGCPDEATAAQVIDTQIRNLTLYYGYRQVPSSADVVIVERR